MFDPGERLPDPRPGGMTRRQLVAGGGLALGALALAGSGGGLVRGAVAVRRGPPAVNSYGSLPAGDPLRLHSRPDLRIPALSINVSRAGTAPGLIFVSPFGPPDTGAVIVEDSGQPVWERPLAGVQTYNFRTQVYRGQPVLTWWQGTIVNGHGVGSYVIADHSYEPIATLQPGGGLRADLHEFLLTTRGTVLLTSYVTMDADLRAVGGLEHGTIEDAVFQEVDLASGRVLLDWHSLDHIPISESYWPLTDGWDYVHLNSIDVDLDGQLLVSARNTHTVYKIDRRSGEIIWRLGGKRSDFAIGSGASFAWQHDARRHPDGTLSIFDNEGAPGAGPQSRAIMLAIDERRRTARLEREFRHPLALQASSMGNVQVLPNGNVFVGWGSQPFVSEFAPSGELLLDAQLGASCVNYRAFRLPWTAAGQGSPRIAAVRERPRRTTLWVSWNGDTRVQRWLVLSGTRTGALSPLASTPRHGFETAIQIDASPHRIAVRGLDANGALLGQSSTLEL